MTSPLPDGPPRWAEWVIGLLCPERAREALLGDLAEQFRRRSRAVGRRRARLWYARQLLSMLHPGTRSRLRAAFAAPPSRSSVLRGLGDDLRHAGRALVRRPGVPVAVALMTASGIAVASAVFAVVHSVLLRPLPYPDSDRILRVVLDHPAYPPSVTGVNLQDLDELRAAPALTAVSAWTGAAAHTLSGEAGPARLTVVQVLEGFDRVLGVGPAAGRFFAPADFAEEAEPAVVVSHRVWTTHLGRRPDAVGSTVLLDDRPTRVVGVLPPLPFAYPDVDLWAPLRPLQPWQQERASLWLQGLARLAPGATVAGAQAEVDGIMDRLSAAFRATNEERGTRLLPLREDIVGPARPMLALVSGATALMVLVVCVNVALLLHARARDRRAELALRASLGGGVRIRRQLFAELALMAAAGGSLGLLATRPLLDGLLRLHPDLPRSGEVQVDVVVIALSAGALALVTLLGGLAPAREARRADPAAALRRGRGGGTPGERRVATALVGAQIALAVTLSTGAVLLTRTLVTLGRVDVGFDAASVVTFDVAPPSARYPEPSSVRQLYEALLRRIRALPGVQAAGTVNAVPFGGSDWSMPASFDALSDVPEERRPRAGIQVVHPGYFNALGIPLVAGRLPGAGDDADAPDVAVISVGLAGEVFASPEAALGESLRFLDRTLEVVGVVADVLRTGLRRGEEHELYVSSLQHFERAAHVVVRVDPGAPALLTALREAVAEVDPALPVNALPTLEERVAESTAPDRLRAVLVGGFAAASVLLAVMGVYAMVAWEVTRRRREMAVRLSVGAAPRRILWDVLTRTLKTGIAGAVAGAAVAWTLGGALEGLVFGVAGRDPATLLTATAALVGAAAAAAVPPAIRASRTDPATVLRDD